jgi:hypothetical protein
MDGLNYKMELYAQYYAETGHGTNSALRAGYAEAGAAAQSTKLLQNPKILELIEEHKADAAALARVTRGKFVRRLEILAFGDRSELFKVKVIACPNCYDLETRRDLETAGLAASLKNPNPDCKLCDGEGIKRASIRATDEIPKELRCLMTSVEQKKDGIKVGTVDQLAAMLLLGKVTGIVVERKELAGPGGGPIPLSHESKSPSLMSDAELDAIYAQNQLRDSVKGVLEGVFLELPESTDDSKGDK